MNKETEIKEFLKTLGFYEEESGYLTLKLNQGGDRSATDVVFLDGEFSFFTLKLSGWKLDREENILIDHNGLSSNKKAHWENVKKQIIDAGYEVKLYHE